MSNMILVLLSLIGAEVHCANSVSGTKIADVNAKVDVIVKMITNDSLQTIDIEDRGWAEAAPPSIKFFFDKSSGKLRAAMFNVGHETWSNQYWYYFDAAENILKYSQESKGLPSDVKVPKMAAIYDGKKRIWSNLSSEMDFTPKEVVALFKSIQNARWKFGG